MKPLSQILEDARSSDQSQDIEMEGLPKQMDDKDMVRLGKKPVLKVSKERYLHRSYVVADRLLDWLWEW